jgi:hypothetical protein
VRPTDVLAGQRIPIEGEKVLYRCPKAPAGEQGGTGFITPTVSSLGRQGQTLMATFHCKIQLS